MQLQRRKSLFQVGPDGLKMGPTILKRVKSLQKPGGGGLAVNIGAAAESMCMRCILLARV